MQPVFSIEDCPKGDILTCRFRFSPDYLPVVYFIFAMVAILTLPKLLILLNLGLFQATRHMDLVEQDLDEHEIDLDSIKPTPRGCCRKKPVDSPENPPISKLSSRFPLPVVTHQLYIEKDSRPTLITPNSSDDEGISFDEINEGEANEDQSINRSK